MYIVVIYLSNVFFKLNYFFFNKQGLYKMYHTDIKAIGLSLFISLKFLIYIIGTAVTSC